MVVWYLKIESRSQKIIHKSEIELDKSSKKYMNELTGKFHYVIQIEF
jgi:hypothetical protein